MKSFSSLQTCAAGRTLNDVDGNGITTSAQITRHEKINVEMKNICAIKSGRRSVHEMKNPIDVDERFIVCVLFLARKWLCNAVLCVKSAIALVHSRFSTVTTSTTRKREKNLNRNEKSQLLFLLHPFISNPIGIIGDKKTKCKTTVKVTLFVFS